MKDALLRTLVDGVPGLLEQFDPDSGRFVRPGYDGPHAGWGIRNQDDVYWLALMHRTRHSDNPYFADPEILDVIAGAGDAIRTAQRSDGRVEFTKVDGSTWGWTYMPWTMHHWLEAYDLVRTELDPDRRRSWQTGLTLAFEGIAAELVDSGYRVHNIPTWNGMALVRAGQVFDRDDWAGAGAEMIRRAVAAQNEHGYWSENGPSIVYNLVYTHAIGLYYIFTHDRSVLDCLRKALAFHIMFTYPDGASVETIDGRVKHHPLVDKQGLPAFRLFPQGRRYADWLLDRDRQARGRAADMPPGTPPAAMAELTEITPQMASALHYWTDGDHEPIPQDAAQYSLDMGAEARVVRTGPWFCCVSAIALPVNDSRWHMNRQSFLGLFHDACGLIVGGGNSRDHPALSNFTVGETHVPDAAELTVDGVDLTYDDTRCRLNVHCDENTAVIACSCEAFPSDREVRARLPLRITCGRETTTADGRTLLTDGTRLRASGRELHGAVTHGRWRIELPEDAVWEYPVLPFNPYAPDGGAPADEALATVTATLTPSAPLCTFRLVVD